jgi:phosphoribosylformylglycinamidine synthase
MRLADGYQLNAFTRRLSPKNILSVPVAHGEGRFVIPPALLLEMQANGLNIFQYCDATGNIIDEFPINPNGSINNIAAVSNKAGNVMAMMPHPERTPNGDAIFQSMADYIASGYVQRVTPLHYMPITPSISAYQTVKTGQELLVDLIITDNQALSVESALQRSGFPVSVQRHTHWEISCESPEVLEKIKATGVLYNERKEKLLTPTQVQKTNAATLLVRPKDDMLGQQKEQLLKHHFGIEGIHSIRHGIIWRLTPEKNAVTDLNSIINQSILFNPYAHDCYAY